MNNNTNNEKNNNKTVGVKRRILAGVCAGVIGFTGYMLKDKLTLKSNKAFGQTMISTLDENIDGILGNYNDEFEFEHNDVPVVLDSNMEYNHSIIEKNENYSVTEGTILKGTLSGSECYYKIDGLCDSKLSHNTLNYVDLGSDELYIEENKVAFFDEFKVNEVDSNDKYAYVRSNPNDSDNNIISELTSGCDIYLDPQRINPEDKEHNWRQLLIEDKETGKVTYGFVDFTMPEGKQVLSKKPSKELTQYIYVIKDSNLYTKEDLDNMNYKVLSSYGALFYRDENLDRDNAIYLPYGTIIKDCDNIDMLDDYNYYLKCRIQDESGKTIDGYVLYRKQNKIFLGRTTEDILQEKNAQLTK